MATLRLRDRDAIITKEGLIFRVFGYSHPPDAYICDIEYAPSSVFRSNNPKAFRNCGRKVFYKFYEDEGLKFVEKSYPQYLILHDLLRKKVVGVNLSDISEVKKPEKRLVEVLCTEPRDELIKALRTVLELVSQSAGLKVEDFGVFGSLLHDFYHPQFSDLDFVIYGRQNLAILRETLQELYGDKHSTLRNEFESDKPIEGKRWRFRNYSSKEFVWHQRRKMIYALFDDEKSGRVIKTEFEPVKDWKEISSEYDAKARIVQKGWVKMCARVTNDSNAPFIPSVYGIEPLDILTRTKCADETVRIISYMEEFRMQAHNDEKVHVEGNLEEVKTQKGSLYQIALTYCPRYYEQVLKVIS